MRTQITGWLLGVAALGGAVFVSCYSPDIEPGGFLCGTGSKPCPDDFECRRASDGTDRCYPKGTGGAGGGGTGGGGTGGGGSGGSGGGGAIRDGSSDMRAASCDFVRQMGCAAGQGCFFLCPDNAFGCFPDPGGTATQGQACSDTVLCARGFACGSLGMNPSACYKFCATMADCAAGLRCLEATYQCAASDPTIAVRLCVP